MTVNERVNKMMGSKRAKVNVPCSHRPSVPSRSMPDFPLRLRGAAGMGWGAAEPRRVKRLRKHGSGSKGHVSFNVLFDLGSVNELH